MFTHRPRAQQRPAAETAEPEARPVGEPKIVIPFVLPTLNDWPAPK